MRIDILTLFPKMFEGPFGESIIKRAQDKNLVQIQTHNLRNWSNDKHKTLDSPPYGGGPGMVIKVDVVDRAVHDLKLKTKNEKLRIILLDAGGDQFNQKKAEELSKTKHIILIAGHYEGVDHRVHEHIADETISIGDYVLTGGEIPAMVVVDTMVRTIPGVLGNPNSLKEESHNYHTTVHGNKEYPQYTRPEVYKGWKVPKVLLSGNHAEIKKWRKKPNI